MHLCWFNCFTCPPSSSGFCINYWEIRCLVCPLLHYIASPMRKKNSRAGAGIKTLDLNYFFGSVLCTSFDLTKCVAILNCLFHRHSRAPTLFMTQCWAPWSRSTFNHGALLPSGNLSPLCFGGEHNEVADTVILGDCFLRAKVPCLINDRLNFHQVPCWVLQDVQEGASFQRKL